MALFSSINNIFGGGGAGGSSGGGGGGGFGIWGPNAGAGPSTSGTPAYSTANTYIPALVNCATCGYVNKFGDSKETQYCYACNTELDLSVVLNALGGSNGSVTISYGTSF